MLSVHLWFILIAYIRFHWLFFIAPNITGQQANVHLHHLSVTAAGVGVVFTDVVVGLAIILPSILEIGFGSQ